MALQFPATWTDLYLSFSGRGDRRWQLWKTASAAVISGSSSIFAAGTTFMTGKAESCRLIAAFCPLTCPLTMIVSLSMVIGTTGNPYSLF